MHVFTTNGLSKVTDTLLSLPARRHEMETSRLFMLARLQLSGTLQLICFVKFV